MRLPLPIRCLVFSRRRSLALVALAWAGVTPWSEELALAESPPEFRVIVHPNNPLRSADREFLADAFLKKVTRWQDGEAIRAVDLRADNAVRRRFSENVLKRSVVAVRSYWQQRIFSGRDAPPPGLESDKSVVGFGAKFPGAVGYVSGGAKLSGVRELSLK